MASNRSRLIFAAMVIGVFLLAQGDAAQTSYSLTVSTDRSSYGLGSSIVISGKVSPPPGPSTAVFVKITNPGGQTVIVGNAPVDASSGSYDLKVTAGGSPTWTAGKYTVNATWGAYQPQVFATASFTYSTSPVTTTSSTVSTSSSTASTLTSSTASSTTSTSASSSSTASTATSSTTSKSGGGIPEFPLEATLVAAVALVVVFAYLVARRSAFGPLQSPRPGESKR